MAEILVEVLPLALAIALSPFPVIPSIMLLLTARPVAAGAAFLGGWVAGVTAALTVAVLVSAWVELAYGTPTWVSWVRLVLGAALIAFGVRKWLTRAQATSAPAWMSSLSSATPATGAKLGLLLSGANPKILVLAAAAGLAIGAAEPALAEAAAVMVPFVLLSSLTVALPLFSYLVAGERVAPPLRRARDWLETHNAAVLAVVFMAIGLMVLIEGISGL
ncbi:MAG: GAP family protein [Actinobacteria bacterium]|nr:GAP family protein [Actinomycetota bacterium]MCB9412993.1 GAP family protein [Actinomycetota bacterium]